MRNTVPNAHATLSCGVEAKASPASAPARRRNDNNPRKYLDVPPKLSTFATSYPGNTYFAEIAQLVEHNLAKVGVASSSLVFRSMALEWWNR